MAAEFNVAKAEHLLAHIAHWAFYALLIILPLTGYLGTSLGTDFGIFTIPTFKDTALFSWMMDTYGITWKEFESPMDVVHHFVGKWIAWGVVLLHVVAAFYHHWVRRDEVLTRMLLEK